MSAEMPSRIRAYAWTGSPRRGAWSTAQQFDAAEFVRADIADGLLEALKGVVRVADRKTVEFDAARAAIARAEAGR